MGLSKGFIRSNLLQRALTDIWAVTLSRLKGKDSVTVETAAVR